RDAAGYSKVNAIGIYQYAAIAALLLAAAAFYKQRARLCALYSDIGLHLWRADNRAALPVENLDDLSYLIRAVRAWPTRIPTRFGFIFVAIAGIELGFVQAAEAERTFHSGL